MIVNREIVAYFKNTITHSFLFICIVKYLLKMSSVSWYFFDFYYIIASIEWAAEAPIE